MAVLSHDDVRGRGGRYNVRRRASNHWRPICVLVAEQLAEAGAELIIGLTSAGRVSPELPLPCLVAVAGAIRDEGTSFHYLPLSKAVACPAPGRGRCVALAKRTGRDGMGSP
jgi:uridine phosphorylase